MSEDKFICCKSTAVICAYKQWESYFLVVLKRENCSRRTFRSTGRFASGAAKFLPASQTLYNLPWYNFLPQSSEPQCSSLPFVAIFPKTLLSCVVLQFHRSLRNWYWHSSCITTKQWIGSGVDCTFGESTYNRPLCCITQLGEHNSIPSAKGNLVIDKSRYGLTIEIERWRCGRVRIRERFGEYVRLSLNWFELVGRRG